MRNYAKVGGKRGLPGYRTPSMFRSRVLEIVRKIPKGKTMTYGQVAKQAGSSRAARAVGNIMRSNFDPSVPCHRVILGSGKAGGYNRGGESIKMKMLEKEQKGK